MNQQEIMTKLVLDNWNATVANTNKLLTALSDDQLAGDIAPGRNSGTYLLGHLTAVNDRMMPLLGAGEQQYPHYTDIFLTAPDKSGKEVPSITELRNSWNKSNERLSAHFNSLQPTEWFQRHTSVTEEDFAKEPHRNKLNIVIGRTTHMSNHLGQMLLLKGNSEA